MSNFLIDMIELHENQFDLALPIVKAMDYSNVVYAIIEKTVKGRIWVDETENPTIVFLWDTERRFYLIGNHTSKEKNEKATNEKTFHTNLLSILTVRNCYECSVTLS